jgi:pyruvate/2-oxoglutarate dehydrogenase complex dihydrolipoamide dehydrogenase (E3) component
MAFDLTVIGGGPAGVTAALRARELGANVALVERGRIGGVCTNDGCVPTRVLAKAARLARDAEQFADYGLEGQPPSVDFVRALTRVQQVVYQVQEKKQLLFHLQDVGVTVFSGVGNAYFSDPRHICYGDDQTLESERFILCVGGSPRRLPFPGNEYAVTHSEVWTMDRLPASVAIVGGGATGCQLASIFNAFGAQVTLVDVAPRLLITEDELVAETFAEQFRQNGIEVITHIGGINSITVENGLRHLNFTLNNQPVTRTVETVILSVGWPGNTAPLNLPAAGVALKGNYIDVNDYLQTSAPHIFAAGDITGRMMLVQSASYEARVAVENALLGLERKAMHRLVPHGGFTDPEYGSIGLTEEQARERHDCVIAVVPYADMDRAVIDGRTVGFCKLIVDRATGLVVGAHVVGELALEVVQLVAAGMAAGLRVEQLADMEIAYPTFSAVVGLAARQIVRELGAVPVAPEWRALKQRRIGEWERRAE